MLKSNQKLVSAEDAQWYESHVTARDYFAELVEKCCITQTLQGRYQVMDSTCFQKEVIVIITEPTVWPQAVELSVSSCLLSVSPENWISDRKWTKDAASLFFISLRGVAFVCATVGWLKLGIDQSSSMCQPHHILCFGRNPLCCQERGAILTLLRLFFGHQTSGAVAWFQRTSQAQSGGGTNCSAALFVLLWEIHGVATTILGVHVAFT